MKVGLHALSLSSGIAWLKRRAADQSMSRKSAQRFCDNDMRNIKNLKRKERI